MPAIQLDEGLAVHRAVNDYLGRGIQRPLC
jgi:hypothetical protein